MKLPANLPVIAKDVLHFSPLLVILAAFAFSGSHAQECVTFQNPPQATSLETGVCTLSVEACEQIEEVTFYADYLSRDGINREELKVATISRAPFKFLWDVTSLPNQLYEGMTISAIAVDEEGTEERLVRGGIFLTHEKIHHPKYYISYAPHQDVKTVEPITLLSSLGSATARAFISWNSNDLVFYVDVEDRLFYSDLPKQKYSQLGIEILIDPLLTRSPFPSKNTLKFVIPLNGKPLLEKVVTNIDGNKSFELVKTQSEVSFPATVKKEDFKGYSISFRVPKTHFGDKIPQTFGLNIIAKAIDSNADIQKMSWVQQNAQYIYSPFVWGTARLQERPLFSNPLYLWLTSFFLGFLIGAGIMMLFSSLRHKKNSLHKFELSQEDKRAYSAILNIIENNITKKNLVLEKVSQQTRIPTRRINALMKKNQNEDFDSFVMRSRVEIAKERLRSSHSSETSVAALCGFRSVEEMEKQFRRFASTTPYRFREEHQVT
ncbi:MAG: helix-turn-helix domain-containing protein [Chitinispirillaceae bacterium]